MQEWNDIEKINCFLTTVFPIVVGVVKTTFEASGCQVTQKGNGIDMVFFLKRNEKDAGFFIHNLLLEIATVDRDDEPLIFDESLWDCEYFLTKMFGIIASKLNILLKMMDQDDIDVAIDEIAKDADKYERIRIVKFDTGNAPKT